ncbi:transglutaminase domain-containing protein [Sulfurimonas sp.]|uniref:transglutaminase domain-containing protein n=1 Tax=Sulfurimonas sp. TaxID=2022749 RepID=UPI0019F5073D|nr:transglutaminase domain-containing protein [Sulfurimonas sp.]MBE0515398.1 transglutaminase domain-containing protein [Sulfurimonas sp.]
MLAFYNAYLHYKEEQFIKSYISKMAITESRYDSKVEYFHAISDFVDNDFNKNQSTWKYTNLKNRPFLRQSAHELLTNKEGVCGEGARVMIRILQSLGYDATRLAFYSKKFGAAHALVSVYADGAEMVVDSINYPTELNQIIRKNSHSMSEIDLMYYGQRFIKKSSHELTPFAKFFQEHYSTYSYEATPYSKLISALGFNKHIFNYDRPNKLLSYIVESVFLIKSIVFFIAFLLWISVYFLARHFMRKI